jgi:2,3-bisphosphoglycerate-dependent phosphoglycerate mutase
METGPGEKTVWMVRHGESTWNVLGLIQGHAEGPVLTEKGCRQSTELARQFRGGGAGAIYASDLARAQQTAAFIAEALGLAVQSDPRLRERCFGTFEGRPLNELGRAESGISDERVVDAAARPEGGESLDEVYDRVGSFLDRLWARPEGGDIIVVTHGGTLRAVRAYSAGAPMSGTAWDAVPNGSVWRIDQPVLTALPSSN